MNMTKLYGIVSVRKVVVVLCLAMSLVTQIYGQTYYVSNSGNDSYSKTQAQNTATPWKTIQHACNNATPGTTIEIMAGTYIEQINIPVSGSSAGGYITLTNYSGGAAIISGNGTTATLLTISNQSYIRVQGLEFYNCIGNNSIGIYIDGVTSNIQILNNTIHHIYWNASVNAVPNSNENAQPFITYGDSIKPVQNITIDNNQFYDNATGFSETCTLDGNVTNFSISYNQVHNNQNIGIDIAGNYGTCANPALDHARNGIVKGNTVWKCHSVYDSSAAGIYVDGGENTVVEQNKSYNNDWGIEVGCEIPGDTTAGIKVRDNIIYRNGGGLQVGGYDGPVNTGRVINSEITNNTLYANDTMQVGNGELSLSYSENCTFNNNIFYATGGSIISAGWNSGNSKTLQFDYNRYYSKVDDSTIANFSYGTYSYNSFASYKTGSGFDTHSIFKDPGLTDTAQSALNFNLLPASSCINQGTPSYPTDTSEHDFNGNTRIVSGRIDIGAIEYQGPNGIDNIGNEVEMLVYPNPATSIITISVNNNADKNSVRLIDIYGRVVLEYLPFSKTIQMNISSLPAGVYIVLLNGKYCSRVVKE